MSSVSAPRRGAAPAPRPPREHRPPLRLVTPAAHRPARMPFVLLVVGMLTAGLLSLLMLNTLAAQDAFRLHDLQRTSATLGDTEQQLRTSLEEQSSPASLAARARALGMVPSGTPAFLRLRDGRIVGVATPAPPAATAATSPATKSVAAAKPAPSHQPTTHGTKSAGTAVGGMRLPGAPTPSR